MTPSKEVRLDRQWAELAEACENASGPDRELDALLMGIGHVWRRRKLHDVSTWREWCWVSLATNRWVTTARQGFEFTASIDRALSLVPEGMILRRYAATRYVPHECEVAVSWAHGGWNGHSDHSFALALCAAALRARASESGQ